jgi:TRAP-type mannitol/chloroaromatic compound transport system substrate-binding protein
MKRRNFLSAAGLGLGGAIISAPAIARSRPEVRWRMVSSFPRSLDILQGGAEFLARRVADLTDGGFQIQVFASGEIMPGLDVFDAVSAGTVPIGFLAGYNYLGKEPALAFDTAIPFGLNTRQQNAWMYQGGGLALMREILADYDIVPFPAGNTGPQMGGWFRQEIWGSGGLNGLKFRVAGMAGEILAHLGALSQPMPGTEINTALEQGTIDAAEWIGPHDDLRLGLHKVARYYYYPSFWEGCTQLSCYVNRRQLEQLPKHYQTAIECACADANLWITAKYDADNPQALKQLVAEGALLRPYPLDILRAAHRTTEEHLESVASGNPRFGKIHASWKRFRDDQRLWFRIAEDSFNRFVSLLAVERNGK